MVRLAVGLAALRVRVVVAPAAFRLISLLFVVTSRVTDGDRSKISAVTPTVRLRELPPSVTIKGVPSGGSMVIGIVDR
jgi:hypothetical protein